MRIAHYPRNPQSRRMSDKAELGSLSSSQVNRCFLSPSCSTGGTSLRPTSCDHGPQAPTAPLPRPPILRHHQSSRPSQISTLQHSLCNHGRRPISRLYAVWSILIGWVSGSEQNYYLANYASDVESSGPLVWAPPLGRGLAHSRGSPDLFQALPSSPEDHAPARLSVVGGNMIHD